MASKYKGSLKKGMRVYIRELSYYSFGRKLEIDTETLYKIRTIGSKQAVVDRIDPNTGEKRWHRGAQYFLFTPEQARANTNTPWGSSNFYPTNWSELFVLAGELGWDAEYNF